MSNISLRSVGRVGIRLVIAPMLLVIGQSCTDLTETPHDALTPENAFHTDAEVLAGVAGVYATLRGADDAGGYFGMEDITTDAAVVPTRGSDWYDNGQWLDVHRQTWTPGSSGSGFFNGAWNGSFGAIAKANLMIDVIYKAGNCTAMNACDDANSERTLAELRVLRAWHYYMLQNMFGGVPLVTSTELKQYPRATRPEVYAFLVTELTEAAAKLPAVWDATYKGRITAGAANALLSTVYINAGVFGVDVGTSTSAINPTGYNSCAAVAGACQGAIDAANAVINSGTYTLSTNWYANFDKDNKASTENIFVIVHALTKDLGGNWPMRTLHYNQLNTGWGAPWNGYATTAEAFNAFPASDDRRNMWLFGQAYSFETGLAANNRTGSPLIFTTNIADLTQASEGEGVRFNKFPPIPSAVSGNGQPNDYTILRLSEQYLNRAEAKNELGDAAGALVDLNLIHSRHDTPLAIAATQGTIRDAILKERLLEFAGEGKRRTDMIRHGKFLTWTEASLNGTNASRAGDAFRVLFPVPSPQLASNPLLSQNPGY